MANYVVSKRAALLSGASDWNFLWNTSVPSSPEVSSSLGSYLMQPVFEHASSDARVGAVLVALITWGTFTS